MGTGVGSLVSMRVNGGFPYITVNDGDYMWNGELYLKHWYEDSELNLTYLEKVMPYVHQLWGAPCAYGIGRGGKRGCVFLRRKRHTLEIYIRKRYCREIGSFFDVVEGFSVTLQNS